MRTRLVAPSRWRGSAIGGTGDFSPRLRTPLQANERTKGEVGDFVRSFEGRAPPKAPSRRRPVPPLDRELVILTSCEDDNQRNTPHLATCMRLQESASHLMPRTNEQRWQQRLLTAVDRNVSQRNMMWSSEAAGMRRAAWNRKGERTNKVMRRPGRDAGGVSSPVEWQRLSGVGWSPEPGVDPTHDACRRENGQLRGLVPWWFVARTNNRAVG